MKDDFPKTCSRHGIYNCFPYNFEVSNFSIFFGGCQKQVVLGESPHIGNLNPLPPPRKSHVDRIQAEDLTDEVWDFVFLNGPVDPVPFCLGAAHELVMFRSTMSN